MPDGIQHGPDHIETASDPAAFADWPAGLHEEMLRNRDNGCVGTQLVSETERVRVWHLDLAPGQRLAFHRHVNPYFWTALTDGTARFYASDGSHGEVAYHKGQTQHYHFGPGDSMLHTLENTGPATLSFTTVEFLDGTNPALDVPASVRL